MTTTAPPAAAAAAATARAGHQLSRNPFWAFGATTVSEKVWTVVASPSETEMLTVNLPVWEEEGLHLSRPVAGSMVIPMGPLSSLNVRAWSLSGLETMGE
jgi:hypothetical protein